MKVGIHKCNDDIGENKREWGDESDILDRGLKRSGVSEHGSGWIEESALNCVEEGVPGWGDSKCKGPKAGP